MEAHKKSEFDFADWFGKRQPGSGNILEMPGDILGQGIYSDWLGENKYTSKESRSLSKKEIKKIEREARTYNRDWLFRTDISGTPVITMSEKTFRSLVEALYEKRNEA